MPTLEIFGGADVATTVILVAASLFVGLSKGGLPGIGMLSVPMLALIISPVAAAVLLLPIYILSDVVAVWLYRKEYSAINLKILIPAGLMGIAIGWSTASLISDDAVALLIGLMGIVFCLDRWFRQSANAASRSPSVTKGLFWGTISGFTSFVSHAGAPPYQIYVLPQRLPKMVFAGTSTILFAIVNLAKVAPYYSLTPVTYESLKLSLILVPIAGVGTMVGRVMIKHLSEQWFYRIVQIALFLISLKLISTVIF